MAVYEGDVVVWSSNGFVCLTDDVDGDAAAIEKIASDPVIRESMRQNNLEKTKQYDITVVEQEIRQICEDVLT